MESKELQELLERHVIESNAIENISVRKNHHLFLDHLKAAEQVVRAAEEFKAVVMPQNTHRLLMGNELSDAGKFRKVRVLVGQDAKARPEDVEKLMDRWKQSLLEDIWSAPRVTRGSPAEIAWHYHHWFEAIHPFVDGNGRTGRLILNNIRLLLGLPWLIVFSSEKAQYYDSIRQWETKHKTLLEI